MTTQEKLARREYRKLTSALIRAGDLIIPLGMSLRQVLRPKFIKTKPWLASSHWVPKEPPFTCKFCGTPSWIDPMYQEAPIDYCHESDHGYQADYEDCYDEPE